MLWEAFFTMVHMQQGFGSDNYRVQDKGHGHEVLFVLLWSVRTLWRELQFMSPCKLVCLFWAWFMIKQEDNEKWVVVQGRSKLFEGGMAKAFGGGKHIHRSGGMHPQDNLDTRKSLLRQFYGQKYL